MKAFIKSLFQYGCYAVFSICILYLTLLSMFGTSAPSMKKVMAEGETPRWEAYNYFLPDSPWKYVLAGILFLAVLTVLCYLRNKWQDNKVGNSHTEKNYGGKVFKRKILSNRTAFWLGGLCFFFFIICAVFIFVADLYPVSDPNKILTIARQLKEHNFEQFAVGGYMHRYPDQTGIVLMYYVIHCIFGKGDYIVIQLMNAALLAGAYYIMGKIALCLWGEKNKNVQCMTVLFCIFFFPIFLYVTLVYGTIPGYVFGIAAFYLQLKYMRTGRLKYMAIAGVCMALAVIWKTNSLIMLIAMCIYLLYDLIVEKGDRRKKTLASLFLLLGIHMAGSFLTNAAMEHITGTEVSKGMPKTAWVAMGLQESGYGPGVWNGYSVGLFEENNYDYDKTNEAAKEKIKELLKIFMDDKSYGVDFFGRKNAMQWNNPTFSCLEVIDGREDENGIKLDSLTHGQAKYILMEVCNYLHTLILIGVCLCLFFRRKEQAAGEMLLGITVVGGLVFHMFWEAKPQYVLPYFLLLLPYSAAGYSMAVEKMLAKKSCLSAVIGLGVVCILIGVVSVASRSRLVSYTVHVRNGQERLEQYDVAVQMEWQEYEERQSFAIH